MRLLLVCASCGPVMVISQFADILLVGVTAVDYQHNNTQAHAAALLWPLFPHKRFLGFLSLSLAHITRHYCAPLFGKTTDTLAG